MEWNTEYNGHGLASQPWQTVQNRDERTCRVSHGHRNIAALRMSQIILLVLSGESFDVVSIHVDTSLSRNNPLVESGHQG
jgi:hypothetical protein